MDRPCLPRLIWVLMGYAVLSASPAPARGGSAEVKLDGDYLAGLVEKMPPLPFESDKARGTVHGYRLTAIDPRTRRFLVSCRVDGEFQSGIAGPWRRFRFEVRLGINIEPGRDGAPRIRIAVDEVRRKEIEGFAGTLAKLLGRYFDDLVTRVAAGKAAALNDRLNTEVVRRVASYRDYGVLTGIEYAPTLVVLHFDLTRFKLEGVVGYVYPPSGTEEVPNPSPPGAVPLYRSRHPRLGAHHYSTNPAEADFLGFQREGVACHVFARPELDAVPLYCWRLPRDEIYTTARDGEGAYRYGYRLQGVVGFIYPSQRPGTVPFYRFVDPRTGRHFFSVHPHAEFAKS